MMFSVSIEPFFSPRKKNQEFLSWDVEMPIDLQIKKSVEFLVSHKSKLQDVLMAVNNTFVDISSDTGVGLKE